MADLDWLGPTPKADREHALRMSMPELRGRAWTPEALHYLAEREDFIDRTVYSREISFSGRLSLLRSLHGVPEPVGVPWGAL